MKDDLARRTLLYVSGTHGAVTRPIGVDQFLLARVPTIDRLAGIRRHLACYFVAIANELATKHGFEAMGIGAPSWGGTAPAAAHEKLQRLERRLQLSLRRGSDNAGTEGNKQ